MKARFIKPNENNCEWFVEGKNANDLGVDFTIIFNTVAPCGEAAPCYEEDVGGVIYVNTYITISKPITYNLRVGILCGIFNEIISWNGFSISKFLRFCFVFGFLDFLTITK